MTVTRRQIEDLNGILLRARKAGMSSGLVHPCLVLHAAGDVMLAGELAKVMGITPASVTGTIDRIEALGWIERVPWEEDRRVRFLRVTPEGRKVLTRVFGELLESP